MLKLSTKGRYGMRAMIDLARLSGNGPVMMSLIAERQDISRKYLHSILTTLKEAGLVRSLRGAKGGYVLAKDPEEIRLTEIVESLEGSLAIVDCLASPGACDRSQDCTTRGLWGELNLAMREILARKTLSDLVKDSPGAAETRPGCPA